MRNDIDFTGISNAPSDYSSADGVMAHLVNFIPENGELKVVGKGKVLWTVSDAYELVYVHIVSSQEKHYIFLKKGTDSDGNEDNRLYYMEDPSKATSTTTAATTDTDDNRMIEIGKVKGTPKIVSIENTLIAYSQDEMRYFLWKEIKQDDDTDTFIYKDLGTHLPELSAQFKLEYVNTQAGWTGSETKSLPEKLSFAYHPHMGQPDSYEKERDFEDKTCAVANIYIQLSHKYGHFIFPFFVRYAYRLYDGTTLTMQSAPILMTPSTSEAFYLELPEFDPAGKGLEYDYTFAVQVAKLRCQILTEQSLLEDYSDVIRSIDIFVSAPIYTYKEAGYTENDLDKGIYSYVDESSTYVPLSYGVFNGSIRSLSYIMTGKYFVRFPRFTDDEIEKEVKSRALCYFVKSISLDKVSEFADFKDVDIEESHLTSLVNKEVMTDDYNSHNNLRPASAFVYNSRLNLANIESEIFSGWSCGAVGQFYTEHGNYENKESTFVRIYYKGHNTQGTFVLEPKETIWATHIPLYLYHPYSCVTEALVFLTTPGAGGVPTTRYISVEMKSHDFLNGSFGVLPFWKRLYNTDGFKWYSWAEYWEKNGVEGTYPELKNALLHETNKIYTSEANMPFYFPVTGINTVGTGNILGLSTITTALSEGQFGQYPLYAFTDEGIWALSLSEKGSISTVTPVTRDVCNNYKTITQTDDAILFSSDRGLMMLSGSTTQCVSEQLDGEWFDPTGLKGWSQLQLLYIYFSKFDLSFSSFRDFVKDSLIAYDYPRQRILVINTKNTIAMAYSLRSQRWGQVEIGYPIAVANSYPNSVLQIRDYLSAGKTKILDVSEEQTAKVGTLAITRPFSFGDKNALKTVNDVIVRGENIGTVLYGTRDYKSWHLVSSSKNRYIRGLCGSPYKAFRLLLTTSLAPGSIITGASFETTPKDNNVLR